ncbi:MAG: transcriptional regulator [Cyclobacteriaceae bacterium]|nr:MAG: transcriptional regulator [Cyclobacteriaceae bacterium]
MPKTHVSKSIDIQASPEKIFSTLNDFNHWKPWSPWQICEPEASLKIADDAKSYQWEGRRIGSGNMRITNEQPHASVDYDLTFLKPWKSTAKVRFTLEPAGDNSKVTWIMDSSLPFFMFWMKKSMEAFIGMDFDRGLNMLKEYVEDGAIKSKLEFVGKGRYPGCQYVGIKRTCSVPEVGSAMTKDFERLKNYGEEHHDNIASEPFSIYHKWDPVKQSVSYTAGLPLKSVPSPAPDGMVKGAIPETATYTVRHIGPYLHLGNAWSTLIAMQRAKEFKPKKGIHPFETYVSMPGKVPETELITDIHFAINS